MLASSDGVVAPALWYALFGLPGYWVIIAGSVLAAGLLSDRLAAGAQAAAKGGT